jgi:hypothetical protein
MTVTSIVLWAFILGPALLLFLSWRRSTYRTERLVLLLLSLSYGWFMAARSEPRIFLGPDYSTTRLLIELANFLGSLSALIAALRLRFSRPAGIASAFISLCWLVALLLSRAA